MHMLVAKKILSIVFQHVLHKRLPKRGWTKIHIGNLGGFWTGVKKTVPDSLPSKKKWQTKCELMEVSHTLSMALGMHRKKLMKHTAATLKTL